jgi:hypothetical protein
MHAPKSLRLSAFLLLVVFSLFNLNACKDDDEQETLNLDSTLIILPKADSTGLQLAVETERTYPNYGYTIEHRLTYVAPTYRLDFLRVLGTPPGQAVLPAISPATTTVQMGNIPTGIHQLEIRTQGQVARGNLIVTDSLYEFRLDSLPSLRFLRKNATRVN